MKSPLRKTIAVLCAVAALSFVAACGGGGSSSSSKESSSSNSSSSDSSSGSSSGGSSGGSNASWCDDVEKAGNEISAKMDATDNVQQANDQVVKDLRNVSSKLPSEIRGDWNKFVDAFANYVKALDSVDMNNLTDPAVLARLEKAAQEFDTPANEALMNKLDAYFTSKCPGYTSN